MFEYLKVSAGVPALSLTNTVANTEAVIQIINSADDKNSDIVVFPELCLTGYTAADIFYQNELQKSVIDSIKKITEISAVIDTTVVVGAPLVLDGQLYNTAVVISGGKVRGIVPKPFLPNYNEFYEKRWFASADMLSIDFVSSADFKLEDQYEIAVGADLIFDISGAKVGIAIGEDNEAPISRDAVLAIGGAELILNLSATGASVSSYDTLENINKHNSARNICASVYVSSGRGESTTDGVYYGGVIACENGRVLRSLRSNYVEDTGSKILHFLEKSNYKFGKEEN